MNKQKIRRKRKAIKKFKPGIYTVAKIDKMKAPELAAGIRLLAKQYKQSPSSELGTLIQYMIGRVA